MAGLREKHKDQRRQAIVAAAAALLRERGLDGLSIADIAARADVAPATVYNLVGGQNAVAAAVLSAAADAVEVEAAPDASKPPLEACLAHIARTFAVFEARAEEIRPALLVYITRRGTPEWSAERPMLFMTERAVEAYAALVDKAQAMGDFDVALDARVVGETVFATLKPRLDGWAIGLFDIKAAGAMARRGAAVVLLSGAIGAAREPLLAAANPPEPRARR